MSGKDSFLEDEQKNIEKTVIMIEHLTEKTDLSKYEVIALGTLLQNIYTGIEGILRYQLLIKNESDAIEAAIRMLKSEFSILRPMKATTASLLISGLKWC